MQVGPEWRGWPGMSRWLQARAATAPAVDPARVLIQPVSASVLLRRHCKQPRDVGQKRAPGLELEAFFGRKIYLELHVKVKKHWRDDEEILRTLGLGQ